jgi:hypothetical protein
MPVQERPDLRDHLLVGAQHAMRVDHDLRQAGGAAGEQVLGMVVGADRGERLQHRRRLARLQQRGEVLRTGHLFAAGAEEHRRPGAPGLHRGPVHRRVRGVDQRRLQLVEDAGDLAEVFGQPAVGAGHRAQRPPDVHRCKRQQGRIDRVVGQGHHGAAAGQAEVEQALRDAPDRFADLPVREAAPAARRVALGQEDDIRRGERPVFQPVAYAAGIRLQRLRMAQHEAAVGMVDTHGLARRQGIRVVEGQGRHARSLMQYVAGMVRRRPPTVKAGRTYLRVNAR